MKNDIEKFVKDHRTEFDDLMPDEKVWDAIENKVSKKNTTNLNWVWKAAAIIFFCTSVFLWSKSTLTDQGGSRELAYQTKELNSELKQVESYYIEMISAKRDLIYTFQEKNEDDFINVEFEEDLQKLDAMYEVLKTEFSADPSKEVVDALVLNLLVRIDILNKKLAELDVDEINEEETEKAVNV